MRREGYEMAITPPQVVMQADPKNPKKMLEPFEEVEIEADLEFCSMIIEKMNNRKGVLMSQDDGEGNK